MSNQTLEMLLKLQPNVKYLLLHLIHFEHISLITFFYNFYVALKYFLYPFQVKANKLVPVNNVRYIKSLSVINREDITDLTTILYFLYVNIDRTLLKNHSPSVFT